MLPDFLKQMIGGLVDKAVPRFQPDPKIQSRFALEHKDMQRLISEKQMNDLYRAKGTSGYGNDIGVGWGGGPDQGIRPVAPAKREVLGASQPSRGASGYTASQIKPLSPSEIEAYANNFAKYAGMVQPNTKYRGTPEAARENAEWTRNYITQILTQAPNYNIDPLVFAAIAAQESGWGGTRYGNNLVGYGVTDEGDMGFHYKDMTTEQAVASLLKDVSSAWDGIYTNQTTPQGFVSGEKKWNYNDTWVPNVQGTLRMIRGR